MISSFFVLSPRGDTILAKQYRSESNSTAAAHERSHTEALFRKIKFWDDDDDVDNKNSKKAKQPELTNGMADVSHAKGDAPPVFIMPDGNTYCHIKRNGLIFGAATARNSSPNTIIEVRLV